MLNDLINKYSEGGITVEELVHLFDINNNTKEEIKKNGVVYTPMFISDYIVSILKPKPDETVFEPSIGHGIFIFSLLEYMKKEYSMSPLELKKYFLKYVYGQDLNKGNVEEFKMIVIAYFKRLNVELFEGELDNYKVGNTLERTKDKFDIIMGNPPYVNIRVMDDDTLTYLRANYESCKKGNIDLYYAFIEHAKQCSKRFSYITPNSWLYNVSAKALRESVLPKLNMVIDFKQKKIFPKASTYTSIILHGKEDTDDFLYSEEIGQDFQTFKKIEMDNKRWVFGSEMAKCNVMIRKYHTPIATLRDKIYVTNEIKENDDFIPFYKISKVKTKEDFFEKEEKIIFPYKYQDTRYVIKEESELNTETLSYLNSQKEELNKRDKGKVDKYDSWFAYGRRQGLNSYNTDTILVIVPGMISKDFKFFAIKSKEIKKPFLFSSGFVLEIGKEDEEKLLSFLNSKEFKNYMIQNGKVWQGKDQDSSYYSLSMTQIKKIFDKAVGN